MITVSPVVGDVTGDSLAIYAFDTLKLGSRWELNGGVRWDRFAVDGVNTAAAPVERTDRMFSFRGGVVYKPKSNGSVYAAIGNSLDPSLEGLSYGNANTAIGPEKTYNLELGSKWDLMGEKLSVSGALFHGKGQRQDSRATTRRSAAGAARKTARERSRNRRHREHYVGLEGIWSVYASR